MQLKITKILIEEDASIGLGEISMNKLGSIVLVAGRNGSGKTRLFDKIKSTLKNKPTVSVIERLKQESDSLIKNIKIRTDNNKSKTDYIANNPDGDNSAALEEIKKQNEYRDTEIKQLETNKKFINWNLIETSRISDKYTYVDFVPKKLDLNDCNSFTKTDMQTHAMAIDNAGVNSSHTGTFSKIQIIQNRYFNSTHPETALTGAEREKIVAEYRRLVDYVDLFLHTKLDRNADGDATLFNLRLGETKLSDGQKVLLQICIAIYSQETALNELILFLDEPENHLHPEALIEVIDKIKASVTDGQLWIATHSINLLAHFDPSCIWYMDGGQIRFSGNLPQQVLTGLLGHEDEICKLTEFLSLPAQMATNQFAFESLFPPTSVTTGSDDPQTNQIINSINCLMETGKKIKLLDFGAGKGRLLATIIDAYKENKVPINSWLDYYAFDQPSEDADQCKSIISSIFDNSDNRYFSNETKFLESVDLQSFDFVIMCNVFHEIDAKDWINTMNSNGLIFQALNNEGNLLIVEDQLMPVGEKAYKNGFLVLDKLHFKKLFKISTDYMVRDARGDGRLKAHFIPRKYITQIDSASRVDAIEALLYTSKTRVKELRSNDATYKNGKLHGFWVQQLANAELALSELK